MATIEGALIGKLRAAAGVAAAVADRVTPLLRPQDSALPALVLNVVDEEEDITHDGPNAHTALRAQVDAYGATLKAARDAAKAAQAALNGYRGTFGGVEFQGVFKIARRDSFEGETPDRIYRVSIDFDVRAIAP